MGLFELETVAGVTKSPAVGGADLVDVEEEGLGDVGGWHEDWEWDHERLVQEYGAGRCGLIVEGYPWVGGSVELGRALVPHDRRGVEELLYARADHAHGVVSPRLGKWYEHRVAVGVGDGEGIHLSRLNVSSVNGIDPHDMFVHRESHLHYPGCTGQVPAHKLLGCVDEEELLRASRWHAALEHGR